MHHDSVLEDVLGMSHDELAGRIMRFLDLEEVNRAWKRLEESDDAAWDGVLQQSLEDAVQDAIDNPYAALRRGGYSGRDVTIANALALSSLLQALHSSDDGRVMIEANSGRNIKWV